MVHSLVAMSKMRSVVNVNGEISGFEGGGGNIGHASMHLGKVFFFLMWFLPG